MPKRLISFAALGLVLSGCAQEFAQDDSPAIASKDEPFIVAHHADYVAATGCEIGVSHYGDALQVAFDHLLFSDNLEKEHLGDVSYARRHSRDFFEPLIDGKIGDGCLTPSLHRIAADLGFPEDGSPLRPADAKDPAVMFQWMSREDYMAETECLVSPTTWGKYRTGFYTTVLGRDESHYDVKTLHQFLQDLGDGRRTEDGFLHPTCLNPALRQVAESAGELDAEGRFLLD